MQILTEKPPEWIMTGCLNNFRLDLNTTLWTYEDAIYNPGGFEVSDDLLAHEQTHMVQQAKYEGGAEAWWKEYLVNSQFRLEQEMQAYGIQYAFFCSKVKDRNKQTKFLWRLSDILSGPLYQVAISSQEARKGIKEVALALKK